MPLLAYHSALPLDFWDLLHSLVEAMSSFFWYLTAFLASSSLFPLNSAPINVASAQYLLGLGTGDITGPVVETNMMGYASLAQTDTGLHMRQRSRAFIVADASAPSNRIVFINADIAMGDTGVRRSIVSQLSTQFPGVYTDSNIAFVGTHQHSGVGGYLENLLPQLTSLGYVKQTADAIVAGTVLAVQRAHTSLAPGKLSLGNTTILNANINRSPSAYLANPAEERARYQFDQDKDMTLLRFDDTNGKARGFLSFFAVHGTTSVEPDALPGAATFVAGFTQSNVGDTSPNTLGAFCESPGQSFDGMACDFNHSTCGGTVEDCHGRGPGFRISDFESNTIIGTAQFQGAQTIMNGPLAPVSGTVKSVHTYMDMATHSFQLPNGTTVSTCPAAMGFSFAGGTTDGPGSFDFIQGDNSSMSQNPFWELVKGKVHVTFLLASWLAILTYMVYIFPGAITPLPSAAQVACQFPKPILLNTGFAHTPYEWAPSTVDIQMFRIGNFVMLIMPGKLTDSTPPIFLIYPIGELTTMSGRRIREAIRAKLISTGVLGSNAYVVVAGPANTYAHYVATREEYSVQRYEGASTIFGQFTLESYIDKYSSLVSFLADNASGAPASDPAPVDQTSKAISLQTGVVFDAPPIGKKFGAVLADVETTTYHAGDTVTVQFVGANPRNNLRLEGTFLTVDQLISGQFKTVRSDSHPSTRYQWSRTSTILGTSTVTITWTIEAGTPAGTYRIAYFGDSKPLIGSISAFSGHLQLYGWIDWRTVAFNFFLLDTVLLEIHARISFAIVLFVHSRRSGHTQPRGTHVFAQRLSHIKHPVLHDPTALTMFRNLATQLTAGGNDADAKKVMSPSLRSDIYGAIDQVKTWLAGGRGGGQAGDGVSYGPMLATIQKHFPQSKMGLEYIGHADHEVSIIVGGVTNMILEMSKWESMAGGMAMRTWVEALVDAHGKVKAGPTKEAIARGITRGINQNTDVTLMTREFTAKIQIISALKTGKHCIFATTGALN
ncbi:Neutral/alkaline non-lysosomal ceramidase-domain-containing protein [Infundibulicybe gibba]|nr:Neutral/alkaline non-lysosomal ceramidase-domain-containing protein [Infundibulicybe gibba]